MPSSGLDVNIKTNLREGPNLQELPSGAVSDLFASVFKQRRGLRSEMLLPAHPCRCPEQHGKVPVTRYGGQKGKTTKKTCSYHRSSQWSRTVQGVATATGATNRNGNKLKQEIFTFSVTRVTFRVLNHHQFGHHRPRTFYHGKWTSGMHTQHQSSAWLFTPGRNGWKK